MIKELFDLIKWCVVSLYKVIMLGFRKIRLLFVGAMFVYSLYKLKKRMNKEFVGRIKERENEIY